MTATPQHTPQRRHPAEGERADLLNMIEDQRRTLLITLRGLTEEQAVTRSTVSELTLGGLVKHLTATEDFWIGLATGRDPAFVMGDDPHRLADGETLAGALDAYTTTARATASAVAALPDLDATVLLPEFPWDPGVRDAWPVRRILLHLLRETAHHCGHADIIREALDGANTTHQMAAPAE